MAFEDRRMFLRAHLDTGRARVLDAHLVLTTRGSHTDVRVPVDVSHGAGPTGSRGVDQHVLTVVLDFSRLGDEVEFAADDVLDPGIEVVIDWDDCQPVRRRIGAPKYNKRRKIRPFTATRGDTVVSFEPYFTFRGNRLAVRVEVFDAEIYRYMRRAAMIAPIHRVRGWVRGTWLIGELPYKAQDNGMRLFRYIRGAYPEDRVFYVIDPDTEDAERLEPVGNVVRYRSREHIRLSLEAKRILGTHHLQYVLPTWLPWFDHRARGIRLFLQHGVAGPKNMTGLYGARAGLDPDYFIVNSDFERELVINDYGYRPGQVKITGFPRFDTLLGPSEPPGKQIVVMPTWRDWLFTRDDVLESQFYEEWFAFLSSETLRETLERHDIELLLVLHPNMRLFVDLFQFEGVTLLEQGEIDIQQLLKESALLVTDYSSVSFDFAFMHKPVLYFMFDREQFNKAPSHLDVFIDMPGRVVTDVGALVADVVDSVEDQFRPDAESVQKADRLLKHRDTGSSERVYRLARRARRQFHVWDRVASSDFGRSAFRFYRRSKYYHPSMRTMFRAARLLPFKRTTLFESGLGKQYTGNPKYMYERLVARGESQRSIWILNTTQRMKDPTTRKIARYTPRFYWNLARAKVWITDQHFPHGLKPGRKTSFIQTWHGTPLKRLLLDQDQFVAQPKDYLAKTLKRIAYWDVMIAQSERAASFFRSAYAFLGPVLTEGYPRNDILARNDPADVDLVRKRLGVPEGKRIVLYAPTFRDDERSGTYWNHDMALDLEAFGRELDDEFFLLVRTHHFVRKNSSLSSLLAGFGKDVSGYGDVQELLLVADVLVTDYSSLLFDFSVTGRPMIFYAYDLEHYRDELRGFYLDYEQEMPGPIVRSSDEVIERIASVDSWQGEYGEAIERFQRSFCPNDDGMASDRVINNLRDDGWL
jgi:CDP-glycerol glycerophosphotransferase